MAKIKTLTVTMTIEYEDGHIHKEDCELATDNDGQLIVYTALYKQADSTIADECDEAMLERRD